MIQMFFYCKTIFSYHSLNHRGCKICTFTKSLNIGDKLEQGALLKNLSSMCSKNRSLIYFI